MRAPSLIVFVAFLVSTEARGIPDTSGAVLREVQNVKRVAQDLVKRLDNIERMLISPTTVDTTTLSTPLGPREIPRSCKGYADRGVTKAGYYTIDPDASGSGRAFTVKCTFGANITTEFGLDSKAEKQFNQPCSDRFNGNKIPWNGNRAPECEEYEITYALKPNELQSLIRSSGTCTQKVMWDCWASSRLYLRLIGGELLVFGANVAEDLEFNDSEEIRQVKCDCSDDGLCYGKEDCNCARSWGKWDRDYITLKGPGEVPLRSLSVGDMDDAGTASYLTVYPITCTTPR